MRVFTVGEPGMCCYNPDHLVSALLKRSEYEDTCAQISLECWKVIGFVHVLILSCMIGSKNTWTTCKFLYPVKSKAKTSHNLLTQVFLHFALHRYVITSSFGWLTGLSVSLVTGQSNFMFFGFGFTTHLNLCGFPCKMLTLGKQIVFVAHDLQYTFFWKFWPAVNCGWNILPSQISLKNMATGMA